MAIIKKGLSELEKEAEEATAREAEVLTEAQKMPWNVDTISKEGFSKSIINKPMTRNNDNLTEEERESRMRDFVGKYEKNIKEFGWLKKFDDSKAYMMEHPHLACEETANYLVIHCLNLQIEEKTGAMEQVAHQCICVQYLLELSKQLDVDPRSCISSFFTKYVFGKKSGRLFRVTRFKPNLKLSLDGNISCLPGQILNLKIHYQVQSLICQIFIAFIDQF